MSFYYLFLVLSLSFLLFFSKENLALNRLTWQQHPWLDKNKDVGSENAVDGQYFDRGTGGQCAISADNKLTSEWRVDLGNVVSINHIEIFYRTDNKPSNVTEKFFLKKHETTIHTQRISLCLS